MCLQTLKRCNRWLLAFLGWTWQVFTICNRLSRNNLPCERLASHLLVFIDASMHGQYFEQLNLTGNFLISHGDGLSEPLCNIFWSPSFYPPAQVLPYCRWWSSITPGRTLAGPLLHSFAPYSVQTVDAKEVCWKRGILERTIALLQLHARFIYGFYGTKRLLHIMALYTALGRHGRHWWFGISISALWMAWTPGWVHWLRLSVFGFGDRVMKSKNAQSIKM